VAVRQSTFRLETKGFTDVRDITPRLQKFVTESGLSDGLLTVFVPGSTAGVTTIEFESGVVEDFRKAVERLIPEGIHYDHDARWGDGNGFSHVRASLLGASFTVPFTGGNLQLGTWQQVVLVDFDNRPRTREVHVQVIGE
jgi:secondary thiamine-phosphate synthase enzyme